MGVHGSELGLRHAEEVAIKLVDASSGSRGQKKKGDSMGLSQIGNTPDPEPQKTQSYPQFFWQTPNHAH